MRALLNDAAARAIRYLDGLNERAVVPSPEAVARLCELDGPLPDVLHQLSKLQMRRFFFTP